MGGSIFVLRVREESVGNRNGPLVVKWKDAVASQIAPLARKQQRTSFESLDFLRADIETMLTLSTSLSPFLRSTGANVGGRVVVPCCLLPSISNPCRTCIQVHYYYYYYIYPYTLFCVFMVLYTDFCPWSIDRSINPNN